MSKIKNARTVEIIDAEIADLVEKRREIGRRLKALRAEKGALIEAERVATEVDLAARFRAAAGDPDALARLAAEVAETVDDDASGAAPPAPEDDPDDGRERPLAGEDEPQANAWG